jgi:uncharacterized protein YdeI (YjbR/CyaY-like superfamily)
LQIGESLRVDNRAAWRAWLAQQHASRPDIWLLLRKKGTGPIGLSYAESVEEALCFGWIDSQTRTVDAEWYAIRFTPRRSKSSWSAANRETVKRLTAEGRMHAAGIAALPAELHDELY